MRKGILPPGEELSAATDKGVARCQWVRRTFDENKQELKYGVQCKKNAVAGRNYCGRHGGYKSGPVTTGKYSVHHPLPRNLRARFEQAQTDPDLLNLTKAISLIDAQIWDVCNNASDQDSFDKKQTKQLVYLIRVQRDLVAQETSRRIAVGSMMDVGEVIQIINYVYQSIVKHVRDSNARAKIGVDLRMLVAEHIPQFNEAKHSKSVDENMQEVEENFSTVIIDANKDGGNGGKGVKEAKVQRSSKQLNAPVGSDDV